MQKKLTVIGALTAVGIAAFAIKAQYFPRLSSDGAYLFWSLVTIIAMIVVVLSIQQLIEGRRSPQKRPRSISSSIEANRRKSFRVTYPAHIRPILVVEKVNEQSKRHLEYQVVDISEEGICFIDDGSLGKAKQVAGRLQFKNGETKPVICDIVRRHNNRVSVRLQRNIAWSALLKEQRKIMSEANFQLQDRH